MVKSEAGLRSPDRTRERLIEAAIAVVAERGYGDTTVRAVGAAAGVNTALVFYHYGGVDQLLLAALERLSLERLEHFRDAFGGAEDIGALVEVAVALFREDLHSSRMAALQEIVRGCSHREALHARIAELMEPWFTFGEEVVRRALVATPLEGMVPIDGLATAAVALYCGMETVLRISGASARVDSGLEAARLAAPAVAALLHRPAAPAPARRVRRVPLD